MINTATNTLTATITVGKQPFDVAVTPNGEYAYVTNGDSGSVSVIKTASNTVTATITLDTHPDFVAVAPNGAYAYVTNEFNSSVLVINTATNTVTATVPVGSHPFGIVASPNGAYVYVTTIGTEGSAGNGSVVVISTGTSAAGFSIVDWSILIIVIGIVLIIIIIAGYRIHKKKPQQTQTT